MAEDPKFLSWHRVEVAKRTGEYEKMLRRVEETVEELLSEKNLKIETYEI